jgi:colanic acid biosynthesis glycosyl transferase WcaI
LSNPRVIFINRVYWPSQAATAQLLSDLAEGLAARDWPVHVIAAGHEPGPRHGVNIHRTGGTEKHDGLLSRTLNYWHFIRGARQQLAALAQPGDVIVPMTDPPMLGAAVTGAALRRGAHVVHWIQDIYPEIVTAHVGAVAALPLSPLRLPRNAAWRSARCCVTLGEGMARALAEAGVPAGHIATVPNWAPRELQSEPAAGAVAARRTAWGLTDRFIVAYSGNLGRVHEFKAVIEAAAVLRAHPEIVFLFVGTGARFDEVRSAARARGLTNIRFLPPEPREQLAASLAAADVQLVTLKPAFARLVYPSKLAGALAAGRPVLFVGPPDGEIARLLAREQCGTAVAPGEGARLAGVVRQWQDDRAARLRLGRQGRAAYERHFAFAPALEHWEEILRRAAAER